MKFRLNDYSPGEAMRIIREWSEMTQTEFAQTINKTMHTIQRYERDDFTYNMNILKEIVDKHGLTVTISKNEKK